MNFQNQPTQSLRPINRQARFLMRQHRASQQNRQLSMLQRSSEEIGQE